ncbi:hypothetical protein BHE74_00049648 [Ensete ventricosum]|nr:hypothetical protein GW17_00055565 [Ensete ventricosum]RWW44575.1 hypothetical protein BHE74_00049648 [Ensete ventricosum]
MPDKSLGVSVGPTVYRWRKICTHFRTRVAVGRRGRPEGFFRQFPKRVSDSLHTLFVTFLLIWIRIR